jgi:hypothetical protein
MGLFEKNIISVKGFKTAETLTNVLKEYLKLPYCIVHPQKISGLAIKAENIKYISAENVMLQDSKRDYPGDNGHDQGVFFARYEYDDHTLVYSVEYNEIWRFGDMPVDPRYSMPDKITIKDEVKTSLLSTDAFISLTYERISQKMKIKVEAENAEEIFNYLLEAFS